MNETKNTWRRLSLEEMIPSAPKDAIDLISKLLTYDPNQRLSAKEVLDHPFISELVNPEDAMIKKGKPIGLFDFEFE
jgi:serine/threonine protein kinase